MRYRSYSCYYLTMINNKLSKSYVNKYGKIYSISTACWSTIKQFSYDIEYIYIHNFNNNAGTLRLVQLINNITECKIVTINNEKYIKYKLLDSSYKKSNTKYNTNRYVKNLALLTILRMSWYVPSGIDIAKFNELIVKSSRGIDSYKFMLTCIKDSISIGASNRSWGNHSCVYNDIKPKTNKQLLNYKGSLVSHLVKS